MLFRPKLSTKLFIINYLLDYYWVNQIINCKREKIKKVGGWVCAS
jgi:hypothetical protein